MTAKTGPRRPRRFGPAVAIAWFLLATGAAQAQASADPPLHAGRIDQFRGRPLEQKVQILADREEIRDLIATYAHRAAHRRSMADLFTDDGAFINRPDAKTPPMESAAAPRSTSSSTRWAPSRSNRCR